MIGMIKLEAYRCKKISRGGDNINIMMTLSTVKKNNRSTPKTFVNNKGNHNDKF